MNPIINNLEIGNNSMKPFSFTWVACFSDSTTLEQYNQDGTENRFQLVKDKFDKLEAFMLTNKEGNKVFLVNLKKGSLNYNCIIDSESEEIKQNIRLIYFRRNKIIFNSKMEKQSHMIIFHLGFQYINTVGQNRQTILQIDEQGNWTLGE